MKTLRTLAVLLLLAAPLEAQTPAQVRAYADSVRAVAVSTLTTLIANIDTLRAMIARLPSGPVPPPPPPPDTTPTPPPPPPPPQPGLTVLYMQDWSGGQAPGLPYYNGNGRLTVATGRGFPNARHLLVEAADGQHSWIELGVHQVHGFISAPVVGQTTCWRYRKAYLLRVSGLTTHGDYGEQNEPDGWGPTTMGWDEETLATSYSIAVMPGSGARMSDGNGYRPFWITGLQYDVAYTRELCHTLLSANSYEIKARVWDASGQLIHDSDAGAFVSTGWYDNRSLSTKMPITQTGGGAAGVRGFIIGTNGFDRSVGGTLRPMAAYAGLVVTRGSAAARPGYAMVQGER